jgi:hypothetical protein
MRNAFARGFHFVAVCILSGVLAIGQQQTVLSPKGARAILDLTEAEQISFIEATMEGGFPEDRADEMTMLIINRSAVAVPLIAAKLEQVLNSPFPSKRFIDVASEMVAYAGDEQSLRAISKLIQLDETRFGRLIGRTIDNAGNWRNSFLVAYSAVDLGDPVVARYATEWAGSAMASTRTQRAWAEAMVARYGRVPDESVWATDPIASQLKDRAAPELRQSILRFAAEAQSKREKR